jgi:TolB-like protein
MELLSSWRRFLRELKRRKVYRVAVTYAVVAFVVWQSASLLFPALEFPGWTVHFVIVLTILGFPIALVVAWAFEVTPEGVRRTADAEAAADKPLSTEERRSQSRLAVPALVGLGLVGAVVAGGWYLMGGGGQSGVTDRSLAVLPFENMSGDSAQRYVADGMTEVLISQLALLEDLTVISRTSVMPYEESELTLPEIAEELNVRYLVEGSVQRSGDEVLIVAQLIDARNDRHLWADRYRRDFTDVFQLQADVAERIAGSVEANVSPSEEERLRRRPTANTTAYDLYLRAREVRTSGGEDATVIELLRQVIALDSTFAEAYAALSDAYATRAERADYGPALADSGLALADTAVALDPDLPEAHFHRARNLRLLGRLTEARRAFRRAVALRPSYGLAVNALAIMERQQGRLVRALERHYRALELNPNYPIVIYQLQTTLYLLEKYDLVEKWTAEVRRLGAGHPHDAVRQLLLRGDTAAAVDLTRRMLRERVWEHPANALTWISIYQGDWERARALLEERMREQSRPTPRTRIQLAFVLRKLGEGDRTDTLLQRGVAQARRGIEAGSERPKLRVDLALGHAVGGRADSAMYWLERAVDFGERDHRWLSSSPLLESLRENARFRRLIIRIREDVRQMAAEARANDLLRPPEQRQL